MLMVSFLTQEIARSHTGALRLHAECEMMRGVTRASCYPLGAGRYSSTGRRMWMAAMTPAQQQPGVARRDHPTRTGGSSRSRTLRTEGSPSLGLKIRCGMRLGCTWPSVHTGLCTDDAYALHAAASAQVWPR